MAASSGKVQQAAGQIGTRYRSALVDARAKRGNEIGAKMVLRLRPQGTSGAFPARTGAILRSPALAQAMRPYCSIMLPHRAIAQGLEGGVASRERRGRVLVMDDRDHARTTLVERLRGEGYETETVERAPLAREASRLRQRLDERDAPTSIQGDHPSMQKLLKRLVQADTRLLVPGVSLAELERMAIVQTLEAVDGSMARAADLLGISRRKLQYRLKEWGLTGAFHEDGDETAVRPRERMSQ